MVAVRVHQPIFASSDLRHLASRPRLQEKSEVTVTKPLEQGVSACVNVLARDTPALMGVFTKVAVAGITSGLRSDLQPDHQQ